MGWAAGEPGPCGCLYRVAPAGGTAGPGAPGSPLTAPQKQGLLAPSSHRLLPCDTEKRANEAPKSGVWGDLHFQIPQSLSLPSCILFTVAPPPRPRKILLFISAPLLIGGFHPTAGPYLCTQWVTLPRQPRKWQKLWEKAALRCSGFRALAWYWGWGRGTEARQG